MCGIRRRQSCVVFTATERLGRGKPGIPVGFVDPGESAEDAMRRAMFEEVNLHISKMTFLASFTTTGSWSDSSARYSHAVLCSAVDVLPGILNTVFGAVDVSEKDSHLLPS
jgi:ADP-ribose pyrophosphatase YjhB (NUDIX family)